MNKKSNLKKLLFLFLSLTCLCNIQNIYLCMKIKINQIMKRILFVVLLFTAGFAFGQTDTIVKWSFPDSAIAVAPYPDGGLAMNSGCMISAHGGTAAVSYTYAGVSTYCARTTSWDAGNGIKYWQVFFATTGYESLKLSSKQRSSNTGPKDFKVQYRLSTIDAWTDVPSAIVLDSNDWTHGILSDVDLPSACDDQDSVYLCWVMTSDNAVNDTALVAAAGSSRIDDISITGAVLVSVPEFVSEPKVTIVQNPNASTITLMMDRSAKSVTIYDVVGNRVFNGNSVNPNSTINTSKLENGIYIIKISFDNSTTVTKKISII
jgi:hypothetical protein